MNQARTLEGVGYQYSGTLEKGLIVYKKSIVRIPKAAISIIKSLIIEKSPIPMGACRDKPSKGSIGEILKNNGYSPQFSSYVIPLLVEEGFCTVNDKKPYTIYKGDRIAKNLYSL